MRFPYLGAARVKYLISMAEHRRQLRRLRGWASESANGERRSAGKPPSVELVGPFRPATNRLDTY